jgi:hypothetical protein
VANKVTNEYNNQHNVINDEAMITQIADFLASVHAELVQQDPDDPNIQVLSTLLTQIGRFYPNIGIFRRPYEEGSLQNMTAIQMGKTKIRKMMFSNLDYADSTDSDVGFAISPASEAVVIDSCERIKTEIDSLLQRLRVEFTGYYDNVVDDSRNYELLSVRLRREREYFRLLHLNQSAALETQLDWFVDIVVANSEFFNTGLKSTLETIRNQMIYLDFLKDLTSSPKVKPNESWKTEILTLVQYVEDLAEWYEFLMVAFARFAEDYVQSRKSTLKFDNLKHWPLFKNFAFEDFSWPSIEKKISLKPHEQKSLEVLLHVLLDPVDGRTFITSSNNCELYIEGPFVRLSDVVKLTPLCNYRKLTATYLFAQYTVFLDTEFYRPGLEMLLGIVAPKWEVVGSHQITLNGSGGKYQYQSTSGDGNAGFPGGPSGTFFGIGEYFNNTASLQIFANGGLGGLGQDGLDGRDGHGDVNPDILHDRACVQSLYCGSCAVRTYDLEIESIKYKMEQTKCSRECWACCPDYTVEFRIVDGPGPTRGYNGGRQGFGGKRSTTSQLIGLRGQPNIKLSSVDGTSGFGGNGGKGGLGGVKNGVYTTLVSLKCFVATLTGINECRRWDVQPGTRAQSAEDGSNNVSGTQIKPEPAPNHETYPVLSKYRLFLMNQQLRYERKINNVDFEFIERASVHPDIKSKINIHQLTDEFIALEDLRKQHPDSNQWLPILNLLLQSIEAASQSKMNSNSTSFAVVANYLSAAILSRKLSIEYQSDRNLIVDVRMFLNEVSKQIEKLANLEQRARLQALKTIYDQDIIAKQQQAEEFLNQQFSDEMDLVNSRIEASINGLLTEVTSEAIRVRSPKFCSEDKKC